MPESIEDFLSARKPTSERPLLGHTILLVEDSRFASEAMRLLCLRSGGRIRRADSLRSADRHLRTYRPSVVIVDLGLPDGSGLDLIRELAGTQPRVSVILATSGDTALADQAIDAGADGFLEKPITSLGVFQEAVLSRLPEDARPAGPRVIPNDQVMPDRLALRDDLEHVLDVLSTVESDGTLRYASRFLAGLAKTAADVELEDAARKLGRQNAGSDALTGQLSAVTGMVEERLKHRAVV
jgi:FixJ family two-component response regulator